jgi:hypothetical protein
MAERDGQMVFRDAVGFLRCADGEGARCILVEVGSADATPVDVYCYLGKEVRSVKILSDNKGFEVIWETM